MDRHTTTSPSPDPVDIDDVLASCDRINDLLTAMGSVAAIVDDSADARREERWAAGNGTDHHGYREEGTSIPTSGSNPTQHQQHHTMTVVSSSTSQLPPPTTSATIAAPPSTVPAASRMDPLSEQQLRLADLQATLDRLRATPPLSVRALSPIKYWPSAGEEHETGEGKGEKKGPGVGVAVAPSTGEKSHNEIGGVTNTSARTAPVVKINLTAADAAQSVGYGAPGGAPNAPSLAGNDSVGKPPTHYHTAPEAFSRPYDNDTNPHSTSQTGEKSAAAAEQATVAHNEPHVALPLASATNSAINITNVLPPPHPHHHVNTALEQLAAIPNSTAGTPTHHGISGRQQQHQNLSDDVAAPNAIMIREEIAVHANPHYHHHHRSDPIGGGLRSAQEDTFANGRPSTTGFAIANGDDGPIRVTFTHAPSNSTTANVGQSAINTTANPPPIGGGVVVVGRSGEASKHSRVYTDTDPQITTNSNAHRNTSGDLATNAHSSTDGDLDNAHRRVARMLLAPTLSPASSPTQRAVADEPHQREEHHHNDGMVGQTAEPTSNAKDHSADHADCAHDNSSDHADMRHDEERTVGIAAQKEDQWYAPPAAGEHGMQRQQVKHELGEEHAAEDHGGDAAEEEEVDNYSPQPARPLRSALKKGRGGGGDHNHGQLNNGTVPGDDHHTRRDDDDNDALAHTTTSHVSSLVSPTDSTSSGHRHTKATAGKANNLGRYVNFCGEIIKVSDGLREVVRGKRAYDDVAKEELRQERARSVDSNGSSSRRSNSGRAPAARATTPPGSSKAGGILRRVATPATAANRAPLYHLPIAATRHPSSSPPMNSNTRGGARVGVPADGYDYDDTMLQHDDDNGGGRGDDEHQDGNNSPAGGNYGGTANAYHHTCNHNRSHHNTSVATTITPPLGAVPVISNHSSRATTPRVPPLQLNTSTLAGGDGVLHTGRSAADETPLSNNKGGAAVTTLSAKPLTTPRVAGVSGGGIRTFQHERDRRNLTPTLGGVPLFPTANSTNNPNTTAGGRRVSIPLRRSSITSSSVAKPPPPMRYSQNATTGTTDATRVRRTATPLVNGGGGVSGGRNQQLAGGGARPTTPLRRTSATVTAAGGRTTPRAAMGHPAGKHTSPALSAVMGGVGSNTPRRAGGNNNSTSYADDYHHNSSSYSADAFGDEDHYDEHYYGDSHHHYNNDPHVIPTAARIAQREAQLRKKARMLDEAFKDLQRRLDYLGRKEQDVLCRELTVNRREAALEQQEADLQHRLEEMRRQERLGKLSLELTLKAREANLLRQFGLVDEGVVVMEEGRGSSSGYDDGTHPRAEDRTDADGNYPQQQHQQQEPY